MRQLLLTLFLLPLMVFNGLNAQQSAAYEKAKKELLTTINKSKGNKILKDHVASFYDQSCDSLLKKTKNVEGVSMEHMLIQHFEASKNSVQNKETNVLRLVSINQAFLKTLKANDEGISDLYRQLGISQTNVLSKSFSGTQKGNIIKLYSEIREMVNWPYLINSKIRLSRFEKYRDTLMYYLVNRFPESVLNQTNRELAKNSKNSVVKAILNLEIDENFGNRLPFAVALYENRMKPEIVPNPNNKSVLFKEIVNEILFLNKRDDQVYKNYLKDHLKHQLRYQIFEQFVYPINDLHDSKDEIRFKVLQPLTAEELYFIILFASDEMYTSSFLYTYNLLKKKTGGKDGLHAFLESIRYYEFDEFLLTLSRFGYSAELVSVIGEEKFGKGLMKYFDNFEISQLSDQQILKTSAGFAEFFNAIKDNAYIRNIMTNYFNQPSKNTVSDLLIERIKKGFVDVLNGSPEGSLDKTSIYSQLAVSNFKYTEPVVEAVFFYDDSDGKASYSTFISTFSTSLWTKRDKGNYVIYDSKKGNPLRVYINKPGTAVGDVDAQQEMLNFARDNNEKISIFVHRGHSYHLSKTIDEMNADMEFAFLGSCGSYGDVVKVFLLNPDVQIISTKKIGTQWVNNPILKQMNESLVNGKTIHWDALWANFGKGITNPNVKENFDSYLAPDQYIGLRFIRNVLLF